MRERERENERIEYDVFRVVNLVPQCTSIYFHRYKYIPEKYIHSVTYSAHKIQHKTYYGTSQRTAVSGILNIDSKHLDEITTTNMT